MLKPFPAASAPPLIHVGREPLYDADGHVVAYRLRFRDTASGGVSSAERTAALSHLIVSAFTEFGLDELVGTADAFVTVNRDFLIGAAAVPFAPDRATLLLAEPFVLDDAAVEGAAWLARAGYSLAVEDGEWGPLRASLFALASYVSSADGVGVRERCPGVKLIAPPGESGDFDLFPGPPEDVAPRVGLTTTAAGRLRLIALLSREDVNIAEVVDAVAEDPAVSYRLLHAAGAAASGQTTKVVSLREAVVLLGLDRIQGWVMLMLLSDGAPLDQHTASVVLSRGRFCRNLAASLGAPPDGAFTVGLLSGLAEVMGLEPAELIASLPLASPLEEALLHGEGSLGAVLRTTVRYSGGIVERLPGVLGPTQLLEAQFGAYRWTNRLLAVA